MLPTAVIEITTTTTGINVKITVMMKMQKLHQHRSNQIYHHKQTAHGAKIDDDVIPYKAQSTYIFCFS